MLSKFAEATMPKGVSPFTELEYWTGILDWTSGLNFYPFFGKVCAYFSVNLEAL